MRHWTGGVRERRPTGPVRGAGQRGWRLGNGTTLPELDQLASDHLADAHPTEDPPPRNREAFMIDPDFFVFIRRCFDEDERRAHAAASWAASPWVGAFKQVTSEPLGDRIATVASTSAQQISHHIEAWEPARVLAKVAADRAILDLHQGEHDCPELVTGVYPDDWPEGTRRGKPGQRWTHTDVAHFEAGQPCPTVLALAQPYVDQPGFREEWRI
jgi:hypothetical protein